MCHSVIETNIANDTSTIKIFKVFLHLRASIFDKSWPLFHNRHIETLHVILLFHILFSILSYHSKV